MTEIEFKRAVAAIEKQLKRRAEDDARRMWREEKGLIYVKSYTVPSFVRRIRPPKVKKIDPYMSALAQLARTAKPAPKRRGATA